MEKKHDLLEEILRLSRCSRRHPVSSLRMSNGDYRFINAIIKNDGIWAAELAKILNVRPASISDALKRIEEKGYIYRETDAADLRIVHLHPTQKALENKADWKSEDKAYRERLDNWLTPEEAESFCEVAEKLCDFFEAESSKSSVADVEKYDYGTHSREDHNVKRRY